MPHASGHGSSWLQAASMGASASISGHGALGLGILRNRSGGRRAAALSPLVPAFPAAGVQDREGTHTVPGAGNPLAAGWLSQSHSPPLLPSLPPSLPWQAGKPSCQLLARPIVQQ